MNLKVEEGKVIIEGNKEDFQCLVDAGLVSSAFLQGTGSLLYKGMIFRITFDNIIGSLMSDEFVNQYRNKFPEGVSRQYGKPFRGVLGKVKENLKRFKKTYKYSDAEILEATENMINRMTRLGKKDFIPQAQYFISHKERGSELAEECESLKNGEPDSGSKWR